MSTKVLTMLLAIIMLVVGLPMLIGGLICQNYTETIYYKVQYDSSDCLATAHETVQPYQQPWLIVFGTEHFLIGLLLVEETKRGD